MNIANFYDKLSSQEQYRLSARVGLLSPKFPRSLFAYENRFQTVTSEISNIVSKSETKLTFLDVGCGDGVYEKLLSKNTTDNMKKIGIDFSTKQLKKASRYFDKTYKVNLDSERLPLRDRSVDIVICSEVLEHLFFPEKIIAEIFRVLKPNGILILTVPNFSSAQTRLSILLFGGSPMINYTTNKEHIRFYSEKDIRNLLQGKYMIKKIRGIGSALFDHWNSAIKLPLPIFFQTIGDKYFPKYANGLMVVATKK